MKTTKNTNANAATTAANSTAKMTKAEAEARATSIAQAKAALKDERAARSKERRLLVARIDVLKAECFDAAGIDDDGTAYLYARAERLPELKRIELRIAELNTSVRVAIRKLYLPRGWNCTEGSITQGWSSIDSGIRTVRAEADAATHTWSVSVITTIAGVSSAETIASGTAPIARAAFVAANAVLRSSAKAISRKYRTKN